MKASFLLLSLAMTLTLSACQTPEQTDLMEEIVEMEANGEMMVDGTSVEDLYVDYTKEAYDSMLGQEPFALFFHAPWCPTCQFMEQDILSNSEGFPEGSVILKADYDTETTLKEKYNITSQSIVVMINADGSVAETLIAPSASTLATAFTSLFQ